MAISDTDGHFYLNERETQTWQAREREREGERDTHTQPKLKPKRSSDSKKLSSLKPRNIFQIISEVLASPLPKSPLGRHPFRAGQTSLI